MATATYNFAYYYLLGGSHRLDIGGEEVGKPKNIYLLLSNVTLDLLYISNFNYYGYSKFELLKYLKFVKLRCLYSLLISSFRLGSHILINLIRTGLVPPFFVFLKYIFKGLLR